MGMSSADAAFRKMQAGSIGVATGVPVLRLPNRSGASPVPFKMHEIIELHPMPLRSPSGSAVLPRSPSTPAELNWT